jgi:itaconate CoA-transferase
MNSSTTGRPLDGVLVVSVEQAVAAPFCTRQLADLGARVIKVERPDGGDFARAYDRRARGLSSHFVWTNRSKESLTLDLKAPGHVAALKTLLGQADIFVQNLAPGAVARLGLDPADLRADNPKLITCSISGYGPGGVYETRKAYDLLVQAEAGVLSVTGTGDAPCKGGVSVADIAAGTAAYQGILAALLQRGRTGMGDHLEISMLEAMAEWMGYPMYYATDGADPPPRAGAGHATIYPYGPYDTADGTVLFGLQNDREWASFCTHVLDRPEMGVNPDYQSNANRAVARDVLEPILRAALAQLTTDAALERLERAGIGTARVNDMAGLWAHPQLAARGRWQDVESPNGPIPALLPASTGGWAPRMDPIPDLGQHSAAIAREFGLDLDLTGHEPGS